MTASTEPPARRQVNDPADPLVQCNVRLPKSVRDQIDARRAVKDMSRDLWVTNAVKFALAQHPGPTVSGSTRTAPPPTADDPPGRGRLLVLRPPPDRTPPRHLHETPPLEDR